MCKLYLATNSRNISMAQRTLLYYPSYVPNENWLKLQLLFWDSVARIVPNGMQDQYGDKFIHEQFGIDPKLSPALSPGYSDLGYFDTNRKSIEKAFHAIRNTHKTFKPSMSAYGVHPSKAPDWVFETLIGLKLCQKTPEQHDGWVEEHYMMNPDAGNLILSCLASNVAARRNFAPVTDQSNLFYLTAANEVNRTLSDRQNSSVTASLGILVLQTLVPATLNKLSFADIISIRDSYGELREAFHGVVSETSNRFGLEKIVDMAEAKKQLDQCADKYIKEYKLFNSKIRRTMRTVSDWKTQSFAISLGALGTYLAAGPAGAVVISIGSAALGLAGILSSNKEKTDVTRSFHYIQKINRATEPRTDLTGIKPYLLGAGVR